LFFRAPENPLDLPTLESLSIQFENKKEALMQFHIEKMHCGGCARTVTKAIQSVDPDATIEANPDARLAEVTTSMPREAFLPVLAEAGYPAT